MFTRFEVSEHNGEAIITLHVSYSEEFSFDFDVKEHVNDLKESARKYIKEHLPLLKMATVVVVVGSIALQSFALDASAKTPFNMSYLFFGNTTTYIQQVEATKGNVQLVSPSYFNLNTDGSLQITSQFDTKLVTEMHNRNIRIVPFVSNHWDRVLGQTALANRENLSTQIANFVKANNLDGINVDIENVTDKNRDDYTDFVRLLREKIPANKEVSVAVAANPNGWKTGWHGSYDYAKLATYADYLMLMTYDEHYAGGTSGAVASSPWVEKSIQYALNQGVPSDKIVLGLPFFGRYWKDGVGGYGINMKKVDEIVTKYNGTITYDEIAKSPKAIVNITDSTTIVGGKTLVPGTYEFWYENTKSIQDKVALVHKYNLKGTGNWSLGTENTAIWNDFYAWASGEGGAVPVVVPKPPPPKIVAQNPNPPTVKYTLLKLGSKGQVVKTLQTRLKVHAFFSGVLTGTYDAKTKQSVINFQKKHKLLADGIAGEKTQAKLYSLKVYPTLKLGSKGTAVTNLQKQLQKQKLGKVTGLYDTKTKQAISTFQKKYKLKVTGIADQQTQAKLFSL